MLSEKLKKRLENMDLPSQILPIVSVSWEQDVRGGLRGDWRFVLSLRAVIRVLAGALAVVCHYAPSIGPFVIIVGMILQVLMLGALSLYFSYVHDAVYASRGAFEEEKNCQRILFSQAMLSFCYRGTYERLLSILLSISILSFIVISGAVSGAIIYFLIVGIVKGIEMIVRRNVQNYMVRLSESLIGGIA